MSILVVLCMYVNGNVPTQYFGCNFGFVSDWILGGKLGGGSGIILVQ